MKGITIGTQLGGLLRHLDSATRQLGDVSERLASGMRINKASDDAAGLAISSTLEADARIYSQALRNINDGISAINIATGTLAELSTISTRLSELAEQGANETYSPMQRQALTKEADALVNEFNRIVLTTKFNGRALFSSESADLSLQAGVGELNILSTSTMGSLARGIGTGTFQAAVSYGLYGATPDVMVGDLNNDGINDIIATSTDGIISKVSVLLGNGDGTFSAFVSYALAGNGLPTALAVTDINADGKVDVVTAYDGTLRLLYGTGAGTLSPEVDTGIAAGNFAVGDFNRDGLQDLAVQSATSTISTYLNLGGGNFTFASSADGGNNITDIKVGDFNGDNTLDIVTASITDDKINIALGTGDGTFSPKISYAAPTDPRNLAVGDFNRDGYDDVALISLVFPSSASALSIWNGSSSGTLSPVVSQLLTYRMGGNLSAGDMNGDGLTDIYITAGLDAIAELRTSDEAGQISLTSYLNVSGSEATIADLNGDGAADIVSAPSGYVNVSLANSQETATTLFLNLSSAKGSREALSLLSQLRDRIAQQTGELGAFQSRLDIAANVLRSRREESLAASARIKDADIAHEAAQAVAAGIRQRIASAVLREAGLQTEIVLDLLRNLQA
ncbi:MAG: VCBS repeat-containing protein [Deltaproteobacteria bacterium]|nr:VCBS repeat-containing protein [Deltaproteobacteria bacterium]